MKIKASGNTEFERFNNVMGKLLSVSHEEMQRRIEADPRGKPKKKKRKPAKVSASRASGAPSRRD
jgi:hypothetical protein